jgi:hypothetical protein
MYVWIEFPDNNNFNLLWNNHYFAPNSNVEIIEFFFGKELSTQCFLAISLGDFNAHSTQLLKFYYNKIKGGLICTGSTR